MSKKTKKITIITLSILILLIVLLLLYNRITINKKYLISEKNIYIPIFVYHNIVENESEIEYDYMQTSKNTFEKQIKGLKKLGYNFITYDELQKYKNNELALSKKTCILTFDDGYKGVYQNVYPIAKQYNIPFTMFIINNNMGQENVITWDEAQEMQNSGLVTIASHSMNHVEFSTISVDEALDNVNNSYKEIYEKLGEQSLNIFTYPYGLYTEEQIIEIEKNGYIQNLTDNKINNSKDLDLSRLHRCYPLSDSIGKIELKIFYRAIKYK